MERRICKKCGALIEGYNTKHTDYLMRQHQLSRKCKEQHEKQKTARSVGRVQP